MLNKLNTDCNRPTKRSVFSKFILYLLWSFALGDFFAQTKQPTIEMAMRKMAPQAQPIAM